MVIAIDGPAGAGKSSVARAVAQQLGIAYLDTGAMYRCVGLLVARDGVDPDDAEAAFRHAHEADFDLGGGLIRLNGEDVGALIRGSEASECASRVAAHPQVRDEIVLRQQAIIRGGDWVADGRDVGTRIAPAAELKLYLRASVEERARRRAAEGDQPDQLIAAEIAARDERDERRPEGHPAADAIELDTTEMTIDEVIAAVVDLARARGLVDAG